MQKRCFSAKQNALLPKTKHERSRDADKGDLEPSYLALFFTFSSFFYLFIKFTFLQAVQLLLVLLTLNAWLYMAARARLSVRCAHNVKPAGG